MQHHVLTRFAALSSGELGRATRPVKKTSTVTKRTLRRNCGAMASSTKGNTQVFPETEQVADAMADLTLRAAETAIKERGAFTVALAGGSLIKLLSGLKGKKDVDWKNWHVFWVDERCVPHNDPESNFGGAVKALLSDVPIPLSNLHSIDESLCEKYAGAAGPCAKEYDARLKSLPHNILPRTEGELPIFDLLLLGFGPDGHICSLFPDHPLLKVTEPWILPITDSPKPPPERITFSLPVVNAAKTKCFTAVGEGKAEMAATILKSSKVGDSFIPASMVQGDVVWLMDEAGASRL